MRLIFIIALYLIPFSSYAETTKPTSIQAKYGHIFTWDSDDKTRIGDGVFATIEFPERRTRFSLGLYHTGYETEWSKKKPITVGISGEALLGEFNFDIDVTLNDGDIQYTSRETKDIHDLVMLGDYSYFRRYGTIKKGSNRLDKTWALDLYATGGVKFDIATTATEYELYLGDELFDTITNPLSGSEASGLKFLLGHTVAFRFSHAVLDIVNVISLPDVKKSFITINIGMAL